MRGFFLVIICVIADCTSLSAQTGRNQSLVSLINSIKSQSDLYFWDQYTHPNADTATVGAIKRLKLCIEAEVSEAEYSAVDGIDPYVKNVPIDRGSLKQIFVYIEKKKVRNILSGNMPQKGEVVADGGKNAGATGNSEGGAPNTAGAKPLPEKTEKFVPDAFTLRLFEAKTFSNVYKLLKSMTSTGQVLQFGKLKDVDDYTSFDLILFDMNSQEIISILSAENTAGTRTNMILGTPDSLSNYPQNMTAVIWYIKK